MGNSALSIRQPIYFLPILRLFCELTASFVLKGFRHSHSLLETVDFEGFTGSIVRQNHRRLTLKSICDINA